jgi:hypothetical protein
MESDHGHPTDFLFFFRSVHKPLKSTVHYWGPSETELSSLKGVIPFSFTDLTFGFKYLGYHLKPGASSASDWSWLVSTFERKIGFWCNKWLSLGGRLILVKTVLQSLAVFGCFWNESLPKLSLCSADSPSTSCGMILQEIVVFTLAAGRHSPGQKGQGDGDSRISLF